MRKLHFLTPLILIAMTYQVAAQSVADAVSAHPPVIREGGRFATRPADKPACDVWVEGCLGENRRQLLVFLSVVGAGKRPLILR